MLTIKVAGDAVGGWMTEIHDGTNFKASSPEAHDEWEAAAIAVADFHKTFDLPTPGSMPVEQPEPAAPPSEAQDAPPSDPAAQPAA